MPAGSVSVGRASGFEFGYDEQPNIVGCTGLTEGTATTILTCASHVFDGGLVLATFFCSAVETPTNAPGAAIRIGLFEAGTLINRFGSLFTPVAAQLLVPFMGAFRFTPSAGAHTYTVAGWVSSITGTPGADAGSGGPGNLPPTWMRFTKV